MANSHEASASATALSEQNASHGVRERDGKARALADSSKPYQGDASIFNMRALLEY